MLAPKANADEGSDTEIVTITIHYRAVDRDGKFETTLEDATSIENAANAEPVVDPYVANIISGSNLNVTVPCRVVPGYMLVVPSYHENTEIAVSGNNLELNLSGVSKDMTFYVYYKEVMVSYSARYFKQNVYNDLYTEDPNVLTENIKQNMKGYPGDEPDTTVIYPDITGFTALFFQPDTIASDGSTIFEVYYDRNYYLMNFNMDGGYGTAPVYARYGTAFTVANPTKSGWSFAGWELEKVNGVAATDAQKQQSFPTTIPTENRTYKAKWTQDATSYTVAYWLENANSDGYSFYSSIVVGLGSNNLPDGSVKSDNRISAADHSTNTSIFGVDGPFISYDSQKTIDEQNKRDDLDPDKNVIVQGDGSTVLNVYFKRKVYNLKFYYAMETSNDQKANEEGHQYIYVIGGSTNFFGKNAGVADNYKDDDVRLLSQYMSSQTGHRGTVTSLPELKDEIEQKNYYIKGAEETTVNSTAYKYYYLMFSAKYGENISHKWPIDIFKAVTRADMSVDKNGWDKDQAYASGWNGEHHVEYCYNASDNQTIKGKYQKLDSNILWRSEHGDPSDMTVSYLCFWENGTDSSSATWNVPKLFYYRLWLPIFEGEDTTGLETRTYKGVTYKLKERYGTCDNSNPNEQTNITIDGYTFFEKIGSDKLNTNNATLLSYGYTENELENYKERYIVDFYYTRTNFTLKYHNGTGYLGTGEGASIPYGKSLEQYGDQGEYASKEVMESQHYPIGYEPNSRTFEGWYTSENFLPGTEMDWTGTMPASNMEVYAKWEPVKYNTYFYLDYEQYLDKQEYKTVTDTPHGTAMTETIDVPVHPTGGDDYRFVGWFYIDGDGTKKAFNPSEMAIRKELHLFAEWTSTAVKEYTVSYQLGKELENGEIIAADPEVFLADKSTGYALEATTKTFTALSKDKLTNFPDGTKDQLWLPHTNSHSIVMRPVNSQNVFTFYYITKDVAPYRVRYLDAATHEPILYEDGKEAVGGKDDNTDAVVTETFRYIPGYIPDAFHKRLVLSANDEENVIIFYYTKDDVGGGDSGDSGGEPENGRARYLVVHHFPELDGSDHQIEGDSIGNIGETAIATEQERPGFEFDAEKTKTEYNERFDGDTAEQNVTQSKVNGKWTVSGIVTTGKDDKNKPLELHLYYKRQTFGYTVYHVDRENGEKIKTETFGAEGDEAGKVPFESVVSVKSEGIAGYDLYAADEDGTKTLTLKIGWDKDLNVITFYYIKKKVKIEYIPVCTDTALTSGFGGVSNPVELDKTQENISGSQAYAASGFYFLGWYKDKNPTDENLIIKNVHIRSNYIELITDVYDYTYYAIFEPITLTISQTNMKPSDSAVYEVVQGDDVIARVMLTGESDSVTLQAIPAGNYTVREVTGNWTWTYTDTQTASVTVVAGQTNTVTFDYEEKYEGSCWLHSENHSENHR